MDNNSSDINTAYKDPTIKDRSAIKDVLWVFFLMVFLFAVAILMINFVFRSYQVDGISMEPTLQNNDKLIIWKVPRTWADITDHPYIPKRGDIIVFDESGLAKFGQQNSKQLIKRVIGLPGDTVVLRNGEYTIYDKQHPHGFDPDRTLQYGKNIPYTSGDLTVKLGPGQLFVSGDNRPDSLDSRDFGPINANQIIGQLVFRIYPLDHLDIY
jgi:signal peptidase I